MLGGHFRELSLKAKTYQLTWGVGGRSQGVASLEKVYIKPMHNLQRKSDKCSKSCSKSTGDFIRFEIRMNPLKGRNHLLNNGNGVLKYKSKSEL